MLKIGPRIARPLPLAALATSLSLVAAAPAAAQIEALRRGDDQFIEELREQGMSDLLQHFVETDPPQDPVNRLVLDVALKRFVADDLLARASEANTNGNTQEAINLFEQSKQTFEEVLAAQKQLVDDHPDDERLPIWQTDYAEMLIDRYLPRYHQNVAWHYEFGLPEPEAAEAFETTMIEALRVTSDATYKLGLLANRIGGDDKLRDQLEEMGIWFRLQDYTRINTPYWYGHAAHGVSLLPDDHAYFSGNKVRNQRPDAESEKTRLRNQVYSAFGGELLTDDRTALTAKMMQGRTLVWSDKVADNDDGVALLEEVIDQADGTAQGFLAKLGKAVGRWKAGEPDTAVQILGGMDNENYIRSDGTAVARLLAADLMFRVLRSQANDVPPKQRPEVIARAYEEAYVPLIGDDRDPRFREVLYSRWAANVDEGTDPASLPPTVRMGIGERLTQQGGFLAQQVMAIASEPAPAAPNAAEQWKADLKAKHDEATEKMTRAARFNETLIGEDAEGTVLAKGLYNLGMNKYWLAELAKVYDADAATRWQPYLEVARHWYQVAKRAPDAANAKDALTFAIGLLQNMDIQFNSKQVQQPEVRRVYKQAFALLNDLWPQTEAAHNNRVYAGFQLYEKEGEFDEAIAVYRALPPDHRDYFQARRQMIYVMHRDYRRQADKLRMLEATAPREQPPAGAPPDQAEALKNKRIAWEKERDALLETLTRLRSEIVDDAEIIIIDAEEVVEDGQTEALRFTSATALGAATVVLAGMEADAGNFDKSLDLLKGFEDKFSPEGQVGQLAKLQSQPDSALATLQGLIQSAQQQRILTLLDAGQTQEMARQAKVMMDAWPNFAASVVGGVLKRLEASIAVQKRIERDAPFELQRERARERIKFFADAAVSLGELLVQWAQGQGKSQQQMVPYRRRLAESLMLAGRGEEALKIMVPIVKEIPNNFEISMMTGKAYIEVYAKSKDPKHYNGAMQEFSKIIRYYNQRPDKPDYFWEAWYQTFRLLDVAGKPQSEVIPDRARMLKGIDEDFGGPAFKERFMDIIERNGGIERLRPGA